MKQLPLILSIVALLATAGLAVKVFQSSAPTATTDSPAIEQEKPLKIAYVNADTLLEKYEFFKKQREVFQKKEKDADASLKAKGRALEKDFMATQQKAQQGLLAPSAMQQEEQRLMAAQQKLVAEQERVTKALLEEDKKIRDELQKAILDRLGEIKKEEGFDFIFSYTAGGQLLAVNDSLDITKRVLEILNAKKEE
jgi:outer membrane protein